MKEKVLVVDDRRENIVFLANNILKPDGYIILTAMNGEKGLQKALEEKPDLIILDLKMPGMSGLEVLEALREEKVDIPVILVTFHGSEQTAAQALRLGASDYLIKPFAMEDMRQAIERALAEKRARREKVQEREGIKRIDQRLEKRLKELSTLYGISKAVTSLLDLEKLLNRIVEAAVYVSGAEEGFLLLIDEETGELYMRAGQGLGEKFARGFRLRVDDSIAGQVIKTGKPVMVGGTREEFKVKTDYLVTSLLNVPLKAKRKVIGVLSVDNRAPKKVFTNNDLFLLSALADYAAIAIENARLYHKTEEEARQLAEALRAQAARISPPEAVLKVEEVEWLFQELASQGQEAEQLAQDLRDQAKVVEGLAESLNAQLAQKLLAQKEKIDDLTRRLHAQTKEVRDLVPVEARLVEVLPAERADWGRVASAQATVLQTILNGLSEGIIVSDVEDKVILANDTARSILGQIEGDLVGRKIKNLCRDSRWEENIDSLRLTSTQTGSWPSGKIGGELSLKMTLWVGSKMVRANMGLLTDGAGGFAGIAIVLHDITGETKVQRLRQEFNLFVSQEIRTPLTAIITYTDLLLGEAVGLIGRTQRRFLENIRHNVERISAVLNELVDEQAFAVEEIVGEAEIVSADAGKIIKQALEDFRERLEKEGIGTVLELADDLPEVEADPESVSQIMIDLLNNAYHCTPPGGTITVRAKLFEGEEKEGIGEGRPHLIVSVSDSGGGIAPEDQRKIFNRFYWTEGSPIAGLGVGVALPVVKALVEAYGGRVWMESEAGVGTTFSFILPMANRRQGALEQEERGAS